jgi:hypothetical protein
MLDLFFSISCVWWHWRHNSLSRFEQGRATKVALGVTNVGERYGQWPIMTLAAASTSQTIKTFNQVT